MTDPYYSDESTTIYVGDCREIVPELSDVDLFFTSPPYNLGTSTGGGMGSWSLAAADLSDGYETFSDDLPTDVYEAQQREIVRAMYEALSPTGAIFYNHKPRPQAGRLVLPTDYGDDLPLRQIIVWDRGTGINFSSSFFLPKHEWIVVWARPDWRLRSKSAGGVGDVWRIHPENHPRHPAAFPIELPATAIEATAPKLVVDPYAGSGSTLVAARAAGVRSIGIELSEKYAQQAVERLAQRSLFEETS